MSADSPSAGEQYHFVSDGLGLPQFPIGTRDLHDSGDHVMGVVVCAWLTHHAIDRWGPNWAMSGGMDLRFRAHLTSGIALTTAIGRSSEALTLVVGDGHGVVYATGLARGPKSDESPVAVLPETRPRPSPVRPRHNELIDHVFAPLVFTFDADRDLTFTKRLIDGEFWRSRRWAHPSWLASATNAVIAEGVSFPAPGHWANAGLSVRQHAPIPHGATITLSARIDDLFDRPRSRFAVAAMTAWVDDTPCASMRNTFVYESFNAEGAD